KPASHPAGAVGAGARSAEGCGLRIASWLPVALILLNVTAQAVGDLECAASDIVVHHLHRAAVGDKAVVLPLDAVKHIKALGAEAGDARSDVEHFGQQGR